MSLESWDKISNFLTRFVKRGRIALFMSQTLSESWWFLKIIFNCFSYSDTLMKLLLKRTENRLLNPDSLKLFP